MDRTTLTRDLRPLEKRGLVASHAIPGDGRARGLTLTEVGRETLARAEPLWWVAQVETTKRLRGIDSSGLRRALDGVVG